MGVKVGDVTKRPGGPLPDDEARQRLLKRLRTELGALRNSLAKVREDTQRLLELEQTRALTSEEAARAQALMRESERLRWELRRLREEFGPLQ